MGTEELIKLMERRVVVVLTALHSMRDKTLPKSAIFQVVKGNHLQYRILLTTLRESNCITETDHYVTLTEYGRQAAAEAHQATQKVAVIVEAMHRRN